MKKWIYIGAIVLVLIVIISFEELFIHKALFIIEKETINLQTISQDKEHVNNTEILTLVEKLENIWENLEHTLCYFANHKDVQNIGVEIARLKATVAIDQKEDFKASLSLIVYYVDVYSNIMGFSIQNLF